MVAFPIESHCFELAKDVYSIISTYTDRLQCMHSVFDSEFLDCYLCIEKWTVAPGSSSETCSSQRSILRFFVLASFRATRIFRFSDMNRTSIDLATQVPFLVSPTLEPKKCNLANNLVHENGLSED